MWATDFEYAGEKLSDYDAIICNFSDNDSIETVSSGADITFNQIKPSGRNKFNLYSSTYDAVYTTTFQICKNPCTADTQDDMYFEPDLISAMQRWLCRKEYNRFKIFQDDYEHIHWNATFSSMQILLNGKIVGLELTLYTDAPYAYMDEVTVEYERDANVPFYLYDSSDEVGYIYPTLKIIILSSGDFTLKNSMDNKTFKVLNCSEGEVLEINGDTLYMTTSLSSHDIAKNTNYLFPRIFNTYDNNLNTFTPSLDCKIEISYYPIKKIGL